MQAPPCYARAGFFHAPVPALGTATHASASRVGKPRPSRPGKLRVCFISQEFRPKMPWFLPRNRAYGTDSEIGLLRDHGDGGRPTKAALGHERTVGNERHSDR